MGNALKLAFGGGGAVFGAHDAYEGHQHHDGWQQSAGAFAVGRTLYSLREDYLESRRRDSDDS
jgi:hypothetical protein